MAETAREGSVRRRRGKMKSATRKGRLIRQRNMTLKRHRLGRHRCGKNASEREKRREERAASTLASLVVLVVAPFLLLFSFLALAAIRDREMFSA